VAHNSYYCPFHAKQKPTGVLLIVNARNVHRVTLKTGRNSGLANPYGHFENRKKSFIDHDSDAHASDL
jgi:hypothetical protein